MSKNKQKSLSNQTTHQIEAMKVVTLRVPSWIAEGFKELIVDELLEKGTYDEPRDVSYHMRMALVEYLHTKGRLS